MSDGQFYGILIWLVYSALLLRDIRELLKKG
jgi:hypothetical protein